MKQDDSDWSLSDAADPAFQATRPAGPDLQAMTYDEQLRQWRSAEDVNEWIGANFAYDRMRASEMSSGRDRQAMPEVYEPSETYSRKAGICVDLAGFAVHALRQVDPDLEPLYLRIRFEPVIIEGCKFEQHWLVSFKKAEEYFFFADTKQPGLMSGPVSSPLEFLVGYQSFRKRKILAFELTDSFHRKLKERSILAEAREGASRNPRRTAASPMLVSATRRRGERRD
jgi:hypothetical protein